MLCPCIVHTVHTAHGAQTQKVVHILQECGITYPHNPVLQEQDHSNYTADMHTQAVTFDMLRIYQRWHYYSKWHAQSYEMLCDKHPSERESVNQSTIHLFFFQQLITATN